MCEAPELGPAPSGLSVTIAYLGGGQLQQSPSAESVDQDWLASARQRLEEMARSICNEQWDPTPSPECRRCDFFNVCPEGRDFISSIGKGTREVAAGRACHFGDSFRGLGVGVVVPHPTPALRHRWYMPQSTAAGGAPRNA